MDDRGELESLRQAWRDDLLEACGYIDGAGDSNLVMGITWVLLRVAVLIGVSFGAGVILHGIAHAIGGS